MSGAVGLDATISAQNSLVGTHANDAVGTDVVVLANSNYVVTSGSWDRDRNGVILEDAGAL